MRDMRGRGGGGHEGEVRDMRGRGGEGHEGEGRWGT